MVTRVNNSNDTKKRKLPDTGVVDSTGEPLKKIVIKREDSGEVTVEGSTTATVAEEEVDEDEDEDEIEEIEDDIEEEEEEEEFEEDEDEEEDDEDEFEDEIDMIAEPKDRRRKFPVKYLENRTRRQVTFAKRRHGIMKKAYELSVLTGANILLLVLGHTGLVYTFSTPKLEPIIRDQQGKDLIRACLNKPSPEGTPQDTTSTD